MQLILIATTFINIAFGIWVYYALNKSRFLFSERFAFISTISASSTISLVAALNLFLLFPSDFEIIGILNLLIGVGIGSLFGSRVSFQTLLAGIYNGGMGSIIGTMLGAVVKNPAICGLPSTLLTEPEIIIFFALLSLCIQGISAVLLKFSFRV